jgi:hypothetical protein
VPVNPATGHIVVSGTTNRLAEYRHRRLPPELDRNFRDYERDSRANNAAKLAALAYAVDDTVACIVGTYGGPDVITHDGKYLLALRRAPGGPWLIAADMDNANAGPDR